MTAASITTTAGPLDVQSIVSQLMTVEQQPLTDSQNKVSTYKTDLSDMGQISSALSALQTSVSSLSSGAFLQTYKATTSDSTIASVATSTGGIAGSYQLDVSKLAQSRQLVFDQNSTGQSISSATTALSSVPASLTFSVAGTSTTVNLNNGGSGGESLQNISDAINSANAGVNASIVQYNGNYSLVIASANSGSANAFSVTAGGSDSGNTSGNTLAGLRQSSTAATESFAASDALMTVNGVNVSSSSNSVTGVISGATVNLEKTGQVSIGMSQDTSGIASSLQSFVDAYNKVHSTTSSAFSSDMKGDDSLLSIQDQLSSVLQTQVAGVNAASSYAYLSQVGISLQKDGTLALDQTAFNKALTSNPTAVANLFGNSSSTGFADRFNTTINNLLGPTGIVTTKQNDLNQSVTDETNHQTEIQTNLDALRSSYVQQYTTLNATLAQMQQSTSNLASLLA
ncbi:flagellar protein [Aquitalea sp. FJL05]|uniref:flagellar filament capping protein FliD n=1 Tax=Aquitalea sp. FJL05 TaxID=2153366 RepID=UPI000F5AF68F|nr:flagellar filament capping protein FliD [Aquitalea sp. FJL05]RQO68203.1 flagellar protein [Aquitalea sp. FJL05]